MHRVYGLLALATIASPAGCAFPADERTEFAVEAVLVSPSTATVQPGSRLQLGAHVTGTGEFNHGVSWSATTSDPAGSLFIRSVSPDGLFVAPSIAPPHPVVLTIWAASIANPGVAGMSRITIPSASITVEPRGASVAVRETLQFQAIVTGVANPAIDWLASPGTIDSRGLYRAPTFAIPGLPAMVRASVRGTNLVAIVDVPLTYRPPVVTALSGPAATRETLRISGSGFEQAGRTAGVLFPTGGPRPLVAVGTVFNDTAIDVEVPPGVVSGPLRVSVVPDVDSEPVFFAHVPSLRLHPDRLDLAPGERTALTVAFVGSDQSWPVSFDADLGTVDAGAYVAPAVDAVAHATVRACLTGTARCSGAVVAVHPFRIEPKPAIVQAGGSIDFVAVRSGPVPVTFSMVSGTGTVTPDGHYVAPSAKGAAPEIVAASDGVHEERLTVAVRGLAPAFVARVADYIDHGFPAGTPDLPWGTAVEQVALRGSQAYALGRSASESSPPSSTSRPYWLDVYDLTDPTRPRWVTTAEMATHPETMFVVGDRLYAFNNADRTDPSSSSTTSIYDVSGPVPVLLRRILRPGFVGFFARPVVDGTSLYVFARDSVTHEFQVEIHSLDDAFLDNPRLVALPVVTRGGDALTARDGRVYVTLGGFSPRLEVWDVSGAAAQQLAAIDATFNSFFVPLDIAGPYLVTGGCYYDTRSAIPSLFSCGLSSIFSPAGGSRFLGIAPDLIDVSDPAGPRIVGHLDLAGTPFGPGVAKDGLLLLPEDEGGIAVYDVSSGLPP